MTADRVEVSWDSSKSNWLVRIQSGEEVIRRHCSLPSNADDATLRSAVMQLTQDEGYELVAAAILIQRAAQAGTS
jgi:hypothetical protein